MEPSEDGNHGRESDDVGLLKLLADVAAAGTENDHHDRLDQVASRIGSEAGFSLTDLGVRTLATFLSDYFDHVVPTGEPLWAMFNDGFVGDDGVATPSDYGCPPDTDPKVWIGERLDRLAQLISYESGGLFRAGPV